MFAGFRTVAVTAAVCGLLWLPEAAAATPATGVTARILVRATAGDTDYVLREITVQPGGSTGWHYHDGTLYALVRRGTLTRTQADCTSQVSPQGSTLVEVGGRDHVHIGRNLGATPLVLLVLYVNPAGSPLAEDAADPGCGIQ
jgi:quercetin dioxygenase-like cupin family protein